ncbi:MAG: glucose-1-phosphate adenylyltransferase subunit GlgD [Erysipelotrichales bacterium]|nr:glucose-1-phosphate adenylyltransferase subunit GlgD [Erysipelotrichales bacterium]
MCNAVGIVNLRRDSIEGIGEYRPLGATSFMGRYRLVDFVLSNFSNSNINEINVFIKDKPRSLIDHIGEGRQYNINTKSGGIRLLGMENRLPNEAYNTDINAFTDNMRYITESKKDYVIIAPCNYIYTMNFEDLLAAHVESGAEVTVAYKAVEDAKDNFLGCECLSLNTKKDVIAFDYNRGNSHERNVSLETYVMKIDVFQKLVKEAKETSMFYRFQDILHDRVDHLEIKGYPFKGYVACVNSLQSYYNSSMWLKKPEIIRNFVDKKWPIYTSTSDSAPTVYGQDAIIEDSAIANGCIIKGTVINSVIGRAVTIEEGAVVKDCVVMAESYIGKGTHIEHAVIDKLVKVVHKTTIKSNSSEPLYIKKFDIV